MSAPELDAERPRIENANPENELERLRAAMEWAYYRALRIAEPAYVHPEGTIKAAESIAARLRKALDA